MELLDKIRASYQEKMSREPKAIVVPEWDATIYVTPLTGLQRDAIFKYVSEDKHFEASVEAIIQRSKDKDGKKLFAPAHKVVLMREMDPEVADRLVSEMGTWDSDLSEDDVKNS